MTWQTIQIPDILDHKQAFWSIFQTTIRIPANLTTRQKSPIRIPDKSGIQMVTVFRLWLPLFNLLNLRVLKSSFDIWRAYASHSFLLNEKTMTGAKFRSIIILTILKQSVSPPALFPPAPPALFLFPPPPSSPPLSAKTAMASEKLSSRNLPSSSTTWKT